MSSHFYRNLPGQSASWCALSHHRSMWSSSHANYHHSSYECTPADRDHSCPSICGSSSHLCLPKDKVDRVKYSHLFSVSSRRSHSELGHLWGDHGSSR